MYELSTTVMVDDREYAIRNRGDYRLITEVIAACKDPELNDIEKTATALILFYEGVDTYEDVLNEFETQDLMQKAVEALENFLSCDNRYENISTTNTKLIDWEQDEKLIVAGINPLLGNGMDVREIPYMHWWTLVSYFMSIKHGPLPMVVSVRDKIVKGKKLDKLEQQFRREHPEYFKWRNQKTYEEKKFEDDILALWSSGK